jgi:hypothetical protein
VKKHQLHIIVAMLLLSSLCFAQHRSEKKNTKSTDEKAQVTHPVVKPESIQWKPFLAGAEIAVISGDPSKEGAPFVIRIKQPDGMKVPPHWHPIDENLTVLAGTFVLGMGEKFDISKAEELPAGTYALLPKKMPHFGLAKGETIVQVHGIGPFTVTFVNPADDPRKKSGSQ